MRGCKNHIWGSDRIIFDGLYSFISFILISFALFPHDQALSTIINFWLVQGDPKKTEPIYFWLKFINLILAFFFWIWSRFCAWKIGTIVFTNMSWSTKEKTFCVEAYFANKSYMVVQANFRSEFRRRNAPSKSRIFDWVKKFREHGTVQNFNSKGITDTHSGWRVSARREKNINEVGKSVGWSPKKSLWRCSQELGISREPLRRVLKSDLYLYPNQIQIKQKLTEPDMAKRVAMCEWFCDTIEDNPDFLDHVWFSGEVHFLLSGYVNSKNNVYWGTAPPEEVLQRPLPSVKCTAWVAISKHGIIGPYWFEDENERSQTVNKERYVAVLRKFWASLGHRRGTDRDDQWFQQDGVTHHTSNHTLDWLRERFQERLISRKCDVKWAPYSLDLNPPDFYLLGYLRDHVNQNNPQTM